MRSRIKNVYMKIYRSRWNIQCQKLKIDGFVSDLRQGIIDVEHVQGSMLREKRDWSGTPCIVNRATVFIRPRWNFSRGFNCAKVALFNRIRWLSTIGATARASIAMAERQEWRNESTTDPRGRDRQLEYCPIRRWSTTWSFRNVNPLTAPLP